MIATVITWVLLILFFAVMVFMAVLLIKNAVTNAKRGDIMNAIFKYHCALIDRHIFEYEVQYDDMESYNSTFMRLWDWGYKRILPKEKFEIIKPYLEKRK